MIKCPVCSKELIRFNKTYSCKNNHSFDIAKQGYINLLLRQSSKVKGDAKEMLEARLYIQERGYYEKLANTIVEVLKEKSCANILDLGCGVGYYTSKFSTLLNTNVIGIDIAKNALKIASRIDKTSTYLVASSHDLPILDTTVELVTNIFSPIYLDEVKRVLKPKGYILVVSPNKDHLIELKEIIYDDIIEKDELRNELDQNICEVVQEKNIVYIHTLPHSDLQQLFLMTPHYWTSTIRGKERLFNTQQLTITFDFNLTLYRLI